MRNFYKRLEGLEKVKKTGLTRKIDDLGRVNIPKEIRDDFCLLEGDAMTFCVEGRRIIMEKYEKSCCMCRSETELVDFEDSKVCKKCLRKIFSSFEEILKKDSVEKSGNL